MRRLCCFELSNKRQGILENLGPHLNPKLYCKSLGLMATSKASSSNVRFMAICADAQPKELVAWKKRANIDSDGHAFDILLDSSALDWMTTYSCTMSWSLHFLILDTNGIIRYNVPRVDPSQVCHQVAQALTTLENQDTWVYLLSNVVGVSVFCWWQPS